MIITSSGITYVEPTSLDEMSVSVDSTQLMYFKGSEMSIITFTTPIAQSDHKEFYNQFIANASPYQQ